MAAELTRAHALTGVESKPFDEPDELIELPLLTQQVVVVGEDHIAWTEYEPGWRWSEHVKPAAGTPSCQRHHHGVVLSGRLGVETDAGARRVIEAGEAYDIPPGHDGWVVGDEPVVTVEFGWS
jgi:hypothetical protein